MDPSLSRALMWGLLAFTVYGAALVAMKRGAADILHPRTLFATPESRRRGLIWLVGAISNFAYTVFLSIALKHGHASLVAALNGWALVVVAVLSRAFLGERMGRADVAGSVAVVAGVVLLGVGSGAQGGELVFDPAAVGRFIGGACLVTGAMVLFSWRSGWWRGATVLGAAAGVLAGVSVLPQKIFIDPVLGEGGVDLGALLPSPWFWLYLLTSNGAFVVLQFAYPLGRAVQVAPALVSSMIVVPAIGGVLCFGEVLSVAQVVGTVAILAGVISLTAVEKEA